MNKSIAILLHAGYWLVYIFLSGKDVFNDKDPVVMWVATVLNGMCSFYTFYFLLVPLFLAKRRFLLFTGWGLAVIIVSAFLPTLLFVILVGRDAYIGNATNIQWIVAQNSLLVFGILALMNGILATIIKGFVNWFITIREKAELDKKKLQMELSLLKARLNPHFLFNTLNNIDTLIETDPKAASAYLQKLSGILRFVVYETAIEKIPLTKELDYIKKYVELQQIRTANKQYVNLKISGDPAQLMIGPMLFIPFIENAFKHAGNKKLNDAITVEILIAGKQINFTCTNIFNSDKSSVEAPSGLGIPLLSQRLDLLYKDHHELKIEQTENTFRVISVIRSDGH